MTVPTRQRTHLLAGPSLSGGSCGSISGDRGRVGHAGHRRGDRAAAAWREDQGRGCHRLQESGARCHTPSSGPRGPAADPVALSAHPHEHVAGSGSLRCARPQSASTKREGGRGDRVTSRTARLQRADLRGQFRKTRSCSGLDFPVALVGILERFALRRPVPCGLAVSPGVVPVEQSSRAGQGATPRPGPPGRSTAGRCHPLAPDLAAQPWSPPARPRSPPRPAAPWTTPPASAPASSRTADSTFVEKFLPFCGGTVPRQRRCPFPRRGRSTSARSRRPTLPLRIGMKLGAVRTAAGRALFRLQVPGADLPGRWVCLTQRFMLVQKSGAGGRAVR